MLYANANSKVGEVEVYRCPHCRDGREIKKLLKVGDEKFQALLSELKKQLADVSKMYADPELHELFPAQAEVARIGINILKSLIKTAEKIK